MSKQVEKLRILKFVLNIVNGCNKSQEKGNKHRVKSYDQSQRFANLLWLHQALYKKYIQMNHSQIININPDIIYLP